MKILIIEDEASLADIIAARLRHENFTADICRNGDDSLYSALSGVYDLIILDVMLPGTGGFEILHELRRQVRTGAGHSQEYRPCSQRDYNRCIGRRSYDLHSQILI